MSISTNGKRVFIARHGETVFNAAGRMQGLDGHTPLTWAGCEQAVKMGEALRSYVEHPDSLRLVASPTGRTLQTLALIVAEIHADWHKHSTDLRLREIDVGEWTGQYYSDLFPNIGDLVDPEHKLFKTFAKEGEDYVAVAARLQDWLSAQTFDADMLVISHGMTARVLRGLMLGLPNLAGYGAPIARSLSQGSMVMICDGTEELVTSGDGSGEQA
jgi:glucosyl-3-phosphoglycerate phosphatase